MLMFYLSYSDCIVHSMSLNQLKNYFIACQKQQYSKLHSRNMVNLEILRFVAYFCFLFNKTCDCEVLFWSTSHCEAYKMMYLFNSTFLLHRFVFFLLLKKLLKDDEEGSALEALNIPLLAVRWVSEWPSFTWRGIRHSQTTTSALTAEIEGIGQYIWYYLML